MSEHEASAGRLCSSGRQFLIYGTFVLVIIIIIITVIIIIIINLLLFFVDC